MGFQKEGLFFHPTKKKCLLPSMKSRIATHLASVLRYWKISAREWSFTRWKQCQDIASQIPAITRNPSTPLSSQIEPFSLHITRQEITYKSVSHSKQASFQRLKIQFKTIAFSKHRKNCCSFRFSKQFNKQSPITCLIKVRILKTSR